MTPAAFTDDTGGGQAIAYIVMDPVMLVDAAAVPVMEAKGCNLTPRDVDACVFLVYDMTFVSRVISRR